MSVGPSYHSADTSYDSYASASEQHQHQASDSTSLSHSNGLNGLNGIRIDPRLNVHGSYQSNWVEPEPAPSDDRRFNYNDIYAADAQPGVPMYAQPQHIMPVQAMHPPQTTTPHFVGPIYAHPPYPSPLSTSHYLGSPSTSSMLPSMPPSGFIHHYSSYDLNSRIQNLMQPSYPVNQHTSSRSRSASSVDFGGFENTTTGYALPVFGGETPLNRSPPGPMDESILSMLFEPDTVTLSGTSLVPEPTSSLPNLNVTLPKLESSDTTDKDRASSFDINIRESKLSEKRQRRLLQTVRGFDDVKGDSSIRPKAEIMAGDVHDPNHTMSLKMLKTYMTSFWVHIHPQIPILHRPTYNSDTCPDMLVLAMMCLGALCLDRTHNSESTQASADWAFFVAHHIRWGVFRDVEFRPTAKLWTFQAMLFLELFEKMFSTRALHERGHIHHATTLTVMRRGSSLIGRMSDISAQDDDPTRTPPGPEGSINASGQNTPDAYWNRWITAEATRRSAFAAFVIDSTHATLFGHSAVMSPHDLRLPLPCDEALWSATSSSEVQKLEAELSAKSLKPPAFLDALRRMLHGQNVRTNTFGRLVLMAGLLNFSWQMNQRDLQISSLGAPNTVGTQMKWKSSLTRAFDFWRKDFDESLSRSAHLTNLRAATDNHFHPLDRRDIVFDSRTCLHSLAHMAMQVDMVDCQIFAGADRVLGRVVSDADRNIVSRRMREHWAPTGHARDAVFFALRFLCEVLIPAEELSPKRPHPHSPPTFTYSVRHDYLLNRPWVLYFAALIVWSYGYALDGPIRPSNYTLRTRELQVFDMQRYLIRMGGVAAPDDLDKQPDRNSCLGLLLLLRENFLLPRWELMHEAGETLGRCIELLLPRHGS